MSYCEDRVKELIAKGKENWTDQEYEDYYVCLGNIESEEAERRYLNGERD